MKLSGRAGYWLLSPAPGPSEPRHKKCPLAAAGCCSEQFSGGLFSTFLPAGSPPPLWPGSGHDAEIVYTKGENSTPVSLLISNSLFAVDSSFLLSQCLGFLLENYYRLAMLPLNLLHIKMLPTIYSLHQHCVFVRMPCGDGQHSYTAPSS